MTGVQTCALPIFLGVYPTHKGLRIDPCVPAGFGDFKLTRRFRDVTYHITVKNPADVQKGVVSMTVDGVKTDGCVIPLAPGKTDVYVEVLMG